MVGDISEDTVNVDLDVDHVKGPMVCVEVGEWRRVGCFDPLAWAHLTADEADALAEELKVAARKVRERRAA